MAHHSDCFIVLLGGYGTLEELLEVITWAQLGIHDKPVGLLNVDGYYNYLLAFIDKAVDDGFIKPSQHHITVSASNAKELVQRLEKYVPVHDGLIHVAWNYVTLDYSSLYSIKTVHCCTLSHPNAGSQHGYHTIRFRESLSHPCTVDLHAWQLSYLWTVRGAFTVATRSPPGDPLFSHSSSLICIPESNLRASFMALLFLDFPLRHYCVHQKF